MKVIFQIIILFVSTLVFAEEKISLKDYLKSELSSFPKMAKETFVLDAENTLAFKKVAPDSEDKEFTFYYGKTAADEIDKSCVVVPQKGKEGMLSIGVCFSKEAKVTWVRVLAHEEERGKGIEELSFLKQFNGKNVADSFQLGKDVDGISGATWSSKAVAEAIRKSSFAFQKYVKGKK